MERIHIIEIAVLALIIVIRNIHIVHPTRCTVNEQLVG